VFTPPDAAEPALEFAVINWQSEPIDLIDVINAYQSEIRPDLDRYSEQDRQAMPDGSWRLTGLRLSEGGLPGEINTFIQQSSNLIGIANVYLPEDNTAFADYEAILNSFAINPNTSLEPVSLSTLGAATASNLEAINIKSWSTQAGVYFITGEVINNGFMTEVDVPVQAVMETPDGTGIVEAVDRLMGYGLRPGEFAPFSLRFGEGKPDETSQFTLAIGGGQQTEPVTLYSAETLTWDDEASFSEDGHLLVDGTVTNTGDRTVYNPRAVITVFDENQRVIAAGFNHLDIERLPPGATAEYHLRVQEMGGVPADYIINIQALPTSSSN